MKKQTILVVEDSDLDFELLQIALKETDYIGEIIRCTGGEEALDYLQQVNEQHNKYSEPLLIFLDLNMPGTNGYDVLAFVRSHEKIKQIPIIIFTSSADQKDIQRAYKAGANSYIVKPLDFNVLKEVINAVKKYWLEITVIPAYEPGYHPFTRPYS